MIGFRDTAPEVNVLAGEYRRLLGYPVGASLDDRARELEQAARAWYAAHGRPWLHATEVEMALTPSGLHLGGWHFSPARLRRLLADASADRLVVVAVSAGPEAEAYAAELWAEGKPDEYYFVEMYASAVVEHLVMTAGARLCALADAEGAAVLPHDSPGYPGWDIAEQRSLLGILSSQTVPTSPLAIEALDSGMLRPKKSLLAAFGITRQVDLVRRLADLVPCDECALERCQFRRRPYGRLAPATESTPDVVDQPRDPAASRADPLVLKASYSVNLKALRRWAAERLTLESHTDGSVHARFRYDGTTCTNMGRPIAWDYEVTLGTRDQGYPIRFQRSAPAAADQGHRSMCRYLSLGDDLMRTIASEAPLTGHRLDDVLTWTRAHAAAGCFCDADSRAYKWGLVFETIHYALAQQEAGHTPHHQEARS